MPVSVKTVEVCAKSVLAGVKVGNLGGMTGSDDGATVTVCFCRAEVEGVVCDMIVE